MPFQLNLDDDESILVELKRQGRGERDIASTPTNIAQKSVEALNSAMAAIYGMSRRIVATVSQLPVKEKPEAVEVTFALKLTTDAKAYIVNAGSEAQITVNLKWERKTEEK